MSGCLANEKEEKKNTSAHTILFWEAHLGHSILRNSSSFCQFSNIVELSTIFENCDIWEMRTTWASRWAWNDGDGQLGAINCGRNYPNKRLLILHFRWLYSSDTTLEHNVEVRAGEGADEILFFAALLYTLYNRYIKSLWYRVSVMSRFVPLIHGDRRSFKQIIDLHWILWW